MRLPYEIRRLVGLGMHMDVQWGFEQSQSAGNPIVGIAGRASGFSEEDLPSDWIGYWLGMHGSSRNIADDELWSRLEHICGVLDQASSEQMFYQYAANGGFLLGWTNWFRRERPAMNVVDRANCERLPPGPEKDNCFNNLFSVPCGSDESWPSLFLMTPIEKSQIRFDMRALPAYIRMIPRWSDVNVAIEKLVQTGIHGFSNDYVINTSGGLRTQVFAIKNSC